MLEVDLSGCISDSSISALSVCPRLQRLHLSRRSMLRDAIAEAQHCPRLYEEDVSCCRNLSPAALTSMIKNCPHLCSVDLGSCLALDDELLVLLAQHCSLRSLDLSNCSKLSDAALQALAMHCVELEELDLHACGLSAAAIESLGASFPALTALHLSRCVTTTDLAVTQLMQCCQHMKVLDCFGCTGLTDVAASAIASSRCLLHTLHLSGCSGITDAGLSLLATHKFLHLRSLHLFGCAQFTHALLSEALSVCVNLKGLDLSFTNATDECMLSVARTCKQLQTLFLFNCERLTEVAVIALAASCPQIQTLDLSACRNASTDAAIDAISAGCRQLHTLKLFGAAQLGEAALGRMLSSCGGLMYRLDLSACEISDLTLATLASHCNSLRRLDVNGCQTVTAGALHSVLDACPALHTLGHSSTEPQLIDAINDRVKSLCVCVSGRGSGDHCGCI